MQNQSFNPKKQAGRESLTNPKSMTWPLLGYNENLQATENQ